jgi:drug/metabolite transporter (DMT)-like permease
LTRVDWVEALKLSAVGKLLYYLCLAAAIQHAGGPLPTIIIGTSPVAIAIVSNRRNARHDGRLSWRSLLPWPVLIGCGIACVNQAELHRLQQDPQGDPARYARGAWLAVGSVACWTWHPIRNAEWLRAHADRPPGTWATARGPPTLPLAAAGHATFRDRDMLAATPRLPCHWVRRRCAFWA